MSRRLIAPSFLTADFANLEREVGMLNTSEADYIHLDIMDGVFVPNISFGFPVCAAIKKYAEKPLDFHLMIKNADHYLERCVQSGAYIISVHFEACDHLHRTVTQIKELGAKAGVALNPHTPIESLIDILPFVDLILLMSVNPGFGGQRFIETIIMDKIKRLKSLITAINSKVMIEVDGGVNGHNAQDIFVAGADILVVGSFIFKSDDPIRTIANLKML